LDPSIHESHTLAEKIYKDKWVKMTYLQKALGMSIPMITCILKY
jgi:hypothetical protein